jgi:hypothetical protein
MTIFVKVGGVWETVTEVYVKQGGVWAQPKNIWVHNETAADIPQNLITGTSFGRVFFGPVFPFPTWGPANAAWWNGNAADEPYPNENLDATFFVATKQFYESPPYFPSGIVGKVVVPYTCNRMTFYMYAQGGAGAASVTNFAAGAGGSGASFTLTGFFAPGGIAVNEFDEFTVTITPENNTTTSGNGANGASITLSWPGGNTITVEGGKGGLTNGTNGAGGVVSGSGPVWTTYSSDPLIARNGNSGTTNAFGINQGGSQLWYQSPTFPPQSREGGVLFGRFGAAGFTYAFDPESSAGGGGGYNSWGQKGGVGALVINFWRD